MKVNEEASSKQQIRLSTLACLPVEETRGEPNAVIVGQTVAEIPWLQDIIVASIRRGKRVLVLHGSTVIRQDDVTVFVTESREAARQVQQLCRLVETTDTAKSNGH